MLVLTLLPVVLLSEFLAVIVDYGSEDLDLIRYQEPQQHLRAGVERVFDGVVPVSVGFLPILSRL